MGDHPKKKKKEREKQTCLFLYWLSLLACHLGCTACPRLVSALDSLAKHSALAPSTNANAVHSNVVANDTFHNQKMSQDTIITEMFWQKDMKPPIAQTFQYVPESPVSRLKPYQPRIINSVGCIIKENSNI